jgi:hypothetical protein
LKILGLVLIALLAVSALTINTSSAAHTKDFIGLGYSTSDDWGVALGRQINVTAYDANNKQIGSKFTSKWRVTTKNLIEFPNNTKTVHVTVEGWTVKWWGGGHWTVVYGTYDINTSKLASYTDTYGLHDLWTIYTSGSIYANWAFGQKVYTDYVNSYGWNI